jgi:hypothetical protein
VYEFMTAPSQFLRFPRAPHPGSASASISTTVWQGTDLREIFWPVAEVAVGVVRDLQIGASVPRVLDNSEAGGSAVVSNNPILALTNFVPSPPAARHPSPAGLVRYAIRQGLVQP